MHGFFNGQEARDVLRREPTRRDRLSAWLLWNGYRKKDLARALGLTSQTFSKVLSGVWAPARYGDLIRAALHLALPTLLEHPDLVESINREIKMSRRQKLADYSAKSGSAKKF